MVGIKHYSYQILDCSRDWFNLSSTILPAASTETQLNKYLLLDFPVTDFNQKVVWFEKYMKCMLTAGRKTSGNQSTNCGKVVSMLTEVCSHPTTTTTTTTSQHNNVIFPGSVGLSFNGLLQLSFCCNINDANYDKLTTKLPVFYTVSLHYSIVQSKLYTFWVK